jgi:hypothetical protein
MRKFKLSEQVKLTDHRAWKDFYDGKYVHFDENWKRFWDENVDKQFTIIGKGDDGGVLLGGLPDYIDNDMNFYSDELEGCVGVFTDNRMFKI